jgi:uncharacterized membrane protein YqaE (UPF0057 family)
MSVLRVILAILCPPLAVLDKGFNAILYTTLGTIFGYVPGVLIALLSMGLKTPHSAKA